MALRHILIAAGLVLAALGLLFIGQGMGYVRWPASSFMIDQSAWIDRGAVIASLGLVLVLVARRLRAR